MIKILVVGFLALVGSVFAITAQAKDDDPVWCSCRGSFADRDAGKRYSIHSFVFQLNDRIAVTSCKTSANDFRSAIIDFYPNLKRSDFDNTWCTYSFTQKEQVAYSKKKIREAKSDGYFADVFAFGYAGEGEPIAGSPKPLSTKKSWCDKQLLSLDNGSKNSDGSYCVGKARIVCNSSQQTYRHEGSCN